MASSPASSFLIGKRNAYWRYQSGVRCPLAFLDDDDEWLPPKIALQLEAARAGEAAYPVISSRMIVRTPTMDFAGPRRGYEAGEPVSEHLFCRSEFTDGAYAMQTSTLFMRRETMLAIPFRAGLKRHQDWDWLLRASRHPGVSFQMLAEPLTIFRVEDERTSVSRAIDWEFSARWGNRTATQLGAAGLNLLLNFLLIPRWSWKGAAVASLLTDGSLVFSSWFMLWCIRRREELARRGTSSPLVPLPSAE